jgi:hypothetical protein
MTLTKFFILSLWVLGTVPTQAAEGNPRQQDLEYFSINVGPLVAEFDQRHVVSDKPLTKNAWYQMDSHARVVVPPGSEAYLLAPENLNDDYQGYKIVGAKRRGQRVTGAFFTLWPAPESPQEMVLARFEFGVDAEVKIPGNPQDFLLAKGRHFQRLWSEQMAGAAMFRHLATTSLRSIGETADSSGPNWPLRRNDGIDDTIQLMSGGRAVSENLQLDRQLATTGVEGDMVSLAGVRGITVREIDWSTRLQDKETELDPLAKLVPHDQYAMFLPSFDALTKLVDQGDALARPAVLWLEPQSRQRDVLTFYQQQLGLPLNALTRQVGGAFIGEVALTGSDPYFRTGTDIAVLMSSPQPMLLQQAIMAQIAATASGRDRVSEIQHTVDGHPVTEWSTSNRHFCSFVAMTDDAVVVCNSLTQMTRVLQCASGELNALGGLDEYRFFRQRYPRGVADESALLIISDATIRRWCGPQWRIAASRRTRARATIAELTMQNADALANSAVDTTRQLNPDESVPDAGKLWLSDAGVYSVGYGTLSFQTPIAEMDMRFATKQEAKLYENWRQQYERQWRNSFDPIALKFTLGEDSVSADLSVIPLMIRTQYRWWLDWVGTARLKPGAGDHHPEAVASLDIAVNMQSTPLGFARAMLSPQGGGVDLLSWIDGSVSVYLDRDEAWMKVLAEKQSLFDRTHQEELLREVPVGVFIPSKNNFRMTAFVVALRGLLQQFAPNMVRWDQQEHHGMTYVVATIIENTAVGDADELPQAYYVTTPEGLTFSLNRNVILRAIDRHLGRKKAAPDDKIVEGPAINVDQESASESDPHSLVPQITVRVAGEGAATMSRADYRTSFRRMARLAWSNIPILNYFRSKYPDRDPLVVYQQLLGERLVEPGGGQYKWVDRFQTYESTHYGHHLAPQIGPTMSVALQPGDVIETGLSFDDGGLRARMTMTPAK